LLLVQIKPEYVTAYEAMLTKLRQSLASSKAPGRSRMARGWRVFLASENANGNQLFVHIVDPATPNTDYSNPLLVINETAPTEAPSRRVSCRPAD
jgi:hypothetical protein